MTEELTEEEKETAKKGFSKIIAGAVGGIVGAAALAQLGKLIVTNYKRSGLTGDFEAKPSDDETVLCKVEVSAEEAEGKLSKDGVNGIEGEIKANETKALASTAEATASDTGAQALQTKAGAMEVKTKGLEIQ